MSRLNPHLDFIKDNNLFFLDLELEKFRNYNKFIEEHFNKTIDNHQEEYKAVMDKIENQPSLYSDLQLNHIQDSLVDRMIEIDRDFVQSFRASIITQLYSFLERTLIGACESYELNHNKEFGVDDLRGNGDFEKAKLFLTKSAKVDIKLLEPNWSFLNNLRVLRNCIVHNNSTVFDNEKRKYNCLSSFSKNRFEIWERDREISFFTILLTQEKFVDEIIENIFSLFEKLEKFEVYI